MKKGILIDVGDTLVYNYNINFANGFSKVFDLAINPKINKEEFVNYANSLLKDIFNNRSAIEFKMIDLINQVNEYFDLHYDKTVYELEDAFAFNSCDVSFVEGSKKILSYFKQKDYRVIVISNTSFSKNIIVKMLGELNNYIEDVIVSSNYPLKKPHHGIFDIGISKLKMEKSNIYYIGNSFYHDVKGSIKAGINSIWFNKDNNMNDPNVIGEYLEIKSYDELIEMDF